MFSDYDLRLGLLYIRVAILLSLTHISLNELYRIYTIHVQLSTQ